MGRKQKGGAEDGVTRPRQPPFIKVAFGSDPPGATRKAYQNSMKRSGRTQAATASYRDNAVAIIHPITIPARISHGIVASSQRTLAVQPPIRLRDCGACAQWSPRARGSAQYITSA